MTVLAVDALLAFTAWDMRNTNAGRIFFPRSFSKKYLQSQPIVAILQSQSHVQQPTPTHLATVDNNGWLTPNRDLMLSTSVDISGFTTSNGSVVLAPGNRDISKLPRLQSNSMHTINYQNPQRMAAWGQEHSQKTSEANATTHPANNQSSASISGCSDDELNVASTFSRATRAIKLYWRTNRGRTKECSVKTARITLAM